MSEIVGGLLCFSAITFFAGLLVGWQAKKPHYLLPIIHNPIEIRKQAFNQAAAVTRYMTRETSGPLGHLARASGELIARAILSIESDCDNKATLPPN